MYMRTTCNAQDVLCYIHLSPGSSAMRFSAAACALPSACNPTLPPLKVAPFRLNAVSMLNGTWPAGRQRGQMTKGCMHERGVQLNGHPLGCVTQAHHIVMIYHYEMISTHHGRSGKATTSSLAKTASTTLCTSKAARAHSTHSESW